MRRPFFARQCGLSLFELLLALAITALVMAPLVPMLETASATARVGGDQAALEQEADFALERIAARIRATAPSPLTGPTTDWLKPAVYVLANGSLVEQLGGSNYTLADSVTTFSLAAVANTGSQPLIRVSLTLTRNGTSVSASSVVRMGGAR